MKARLLHSLQAIYTSYWLLPAVMVAAAFTLALVLIALDESGVLKAIGGTHWLTRNHAAGARDVLSTIAGSTISVAGVTFSITILSVANAASQMGPSLLRNFMRDRGSQMTLGFLLGTFLYCLAVLRTVRSGGDTEFVPHLALFGALVLSVLCIAVLIYFFHHVPERLNIANLVREVGRDLALSAPAGSDERHKAPTDPVGHAGRADVSGASLSLVSPDSGYLVAANSDAYENLLESVGARLEFVRHPGDFVLSGEPYANLLLDSSRPLNAERRDQLLGKLQALVVLAAKRSEVEDPRFMVNQLVEVAARALSPGVNAPLTAALCVDALFGALARWGDPNTDGSPDEGSDRCRKMPLTFVELLDQGCDALRTYGAGDRILGRHLLGGLLSLKTAVAPRWHPAIDAQRERLFQSGMQLLTDDRDRRDWERVHRA